MNKIRISIVKRTNFLRKTDLRMFITLEPEGTVKVRKYVHLSRKEYYCQNNKVHLDVTNKYNYFIRFSQ